MNAWALAFGTAWGVAWGADGTTPPPPPVADPLPTVAGTAAPRRIVVPPDMAIAARRLAGDNGVVEAFLAMLMVDIFNGQGEGP